MELKLDMVSEMVTYESNLSTILRRGVQQFLVGHLGCANV